MTIRPSEEFDVAWLERLSRQRHLQRYLVATTAFTRYYLWRPGGDKRDGKRKDDK
jgi:hypothetical protein